MPELDYDLLADLVAEKLAQRLALRLGGHPELADAKTNPLGSERAFLDAHRRGDFPTFKRGREIVARWEDVLAYIQRRPTRSEPIPPAAPPEPAPVANDVTLDAAALLDDVLGRRRPRRAGGT